jgi:hypothetical protein
VKKWATPPRNYTNNKSGSEPEDFPYDGIGERDLGWGRETPVPIKRAGAGHAKGCVAGFIEAVEPWGGTSNSGWGSRLDLPLSVVCNAQLERPSSL